MELAVGTGRIAAPLARRGVPVRGNTGGYVGFGQFDTATQRYSAHHVHVDDGGGRFRSIPFRYVWPAELDLMARIAGMRLRDRWADWDRSPFTHESTKHVSTWEKV